MHLITPFKCMLTLALHLPCNWRPQNGTMNKAERAERTPPVLPLPIRARVAVLPASLVPAPAS